MSAIATIKIAIIAAMEREVRPLIRSWPVRIVEHSGRKYRLFEKDNVALICGGIGSAAARRATEAMIEEVKPSRVISVGFAGALDSSLRVADIIEPRIVINAADGVRNEIGLGAGTLVSSATVAGQEQKAQLAKAFGASAVDMEAAAVAQGAQALGVEFAALKAISDAVDFSLPAIERFVADDGSFHVASFACHVALRPWLWMKTLALAQNSSKASEALCGALAGYLGREAGVTRVSAEKPLLAELSRTELSGTRLNEVESNRDELNQIKPGSKSASEHTYAAVEGQTDRKTVG
jgi:adenosylhomocysteine nucleosidase